MKCSDKFINNIRYIKSNTCEKICEQWTGKCPVPFKNRHSITVTSKKGPCWRSIRYRLMSGNNKK